MIRIHVIAILSCVFSVSGNSGDDCAPEKCEVRTRTEAGWLCGRVRLAEDGAPYASFRGVPYAKPPLGERRFKELVPPDPWDGNRDATEDSPSCPQKDMIYGRLTLYKTGMSEDCMYLNVHIPMKYFPQEENQPANVTGLPILVMIHGGGFNTGSGLTDLHGPEYLMTGDVMVVTFNYRINVLGFLSLNSKEVPGNQALRDQVTLLRWVQMNARAFGGDPDNVTIMGQSAGASCAHLLTLSKATEGLFKRVILMSGTGIPNFFSASPRFAQDIADSFLSVLGINATDPAEIHQKLVQLDIIDIMYANTVTQNTYGLTSFVPVVEREYHGVTRILDDDPLELIANGRGKEFPTLIGFTDKETETFRWLSMTLDLVRRVQENPELILSPRLKYNLPETELSNVANIAYQKCFNGTVSLDNFLHYLSYSFFKYPAIKLAEWRSKHAPTYLYKYWYKSERSLIKEGYWTVYEGAAHIEDLTYVFRVNSLLGDYVAFPPKNDDDRMKEWLTKMVINFTRCSNPTCTSDERDWSPISEGRIVYQSIAEPRAYRMSELTDEETDMVNFMEGIDSEIRSITERLK